MHWRERAVEEGLAPLTERIGIEAFTTAAKHPLLFRTGGALLRRTPWELGGTSLPVLGAWAKERTLPEPSPKSFRSLWRDGIE